MLRMASDAPTAYNDPSSDVCYTAVHDVPGQTWVIMMT